MFEVVYKRVNKIGLTKSLLTLDLWMDFEILTDYSNYYCYLLMMSDYSYCLAFVNCCDDAVSSRFCVPSCADVLEKKLNRHHLKKKNFEFAGKILDGSSMCIASEKDKKKVKLVEE